MFRNVDVADVNASTPFESTCADVNELPYSDTWNGSVIDVTQSSQELPVLSVAAVNVPVIHAVV